MATPDIDKLALSDSDTEDLFASPSRASKKKSTSTSNNNIPQHINGPPPRNGGESKYDAEQARDDALQRELESVRSINDVIEGVISSLDSAKGSMHTVSRTVTSASTLLNTWIRILSQTEHNQRLILNPNWQGASQDVADIENDAVMKAQAAERRAAEEDRRREEARRKAEDEERQRQAGTQVVRGTRGSRGRGRGAPSRGISSGYGSGGSSLGRTPSQSGSRGGVPRGTRGRPRVLR